MSDIYEDKLIALGYTLEPVELASGRLMRAVRSGNLIFTSGQTSGWGDRQIKGQVGGDLTVEQGYQAAQLATVNALRAVKSLAGGLAQIVQIVKVLGLVNVAPGFNETPAVIHGCSDLLLDVFGEAGRHARSAIGVVVPLNFAVEIELVAEVRSPGGPREN
jgi:enamine deaminase RidA (YjgF/YER057c/UK114 family)